MYRLSFLFLALPLVTWAQEPSTETVVRLQIQPTPAPKLALRYQLLPELREMNPGNPVQEFMKCLLDQKDLFTKESKEKRENWEKMELKALPIKELRDYAKKAAIQADFAARLDTPDWQLLVIFKNPDADLSGPFNVLPMLEFARVLRSRLRGQVAACQFESALVTLKTMFALARVMGEHPTLLGNLVSNAVGILTIKPLEEMLQQPGCPNLYWALTYLPHPLIDLRKCWQGEKILMMQGFEKLDDKASMSESQIQKIVGQYQTELNKSFGPALTTKGIKIPSYSESIAEKVKDKKYIQLARNRLIEYGLAENVVQHFPESQVILLDKKIEIEISLDESMKVLALPYWQGKLAEVGIKEVKGDLPSLELFGQGATTHRLFNRSQDAQVGLEQRLAHLRCIEAVRMYAAENDGKLPARLEDIKLPLPVDPVTGQPFQYRLDAGIAHLRGTLIPGLEKNPHYDVRYEITIRK